MTPDPAIWYQRKPGSLAWYQIGQPERACFAKVCAQCKREFLGPRKQGLCSTECRAAAHRTGPTTVTRVCAQCGKEFPTKKGHLARGRGKFCSLTCRGLSSRKDVVTYVIAHRRVRRAKGIASGHLCVDCGARGAQWSYDGLDPDELTEPHGKYKGLKYSAKIEHYTPRCASCHKQYDGHVGETHVRAKLTDAQRRAIEVSVGATTRELAEHFGVSKSRVSQIRSAASQDETED